MALIIKVPGSGSSFAGPALPPPDPAMPTAGALMLVDPTHPGGLWDAGAPADGARVPNVAAAQARALLGNTATVDPTIVNTGMTGTVGKVERTSKGGVGAILSTTNTTSGAGFAVLAPLSIVSYLQANKTHGFYWSLWYRVTRVQTPSSTNYPVGAFVSTTSAYAMGIVSNGYQTPYNLGYGSSGPYQQTANYWRGVAGSPLPDGFATADPATVDRYFYQCGNYGMGNRTGAQVGKTGSRVFYRAYLEDLTVSGRTYAQAATADQNEFAAQVNTAGGRYYGDTSTDPATLP